MSKKEIYLNNPNLPTVNAAFDYTPKMVSEIKKCGENLIHFAETYFYIISLDEGKQTIALHLYQKKALRMMRDNRFSLLLFSRQTGKSTISAIFCLWQACFNENQNIIIVANKENTAKTIFKRLRLAYESLPNWLKPGVREYGKESMELANGSTIGITTTTGTAGRGSSANLIFIDEADWIESGLLTEFWSSVYPIISSSKKSKIIMASTPRDTSGLFYRLYSDSLTGENNWVHMKITWDQVPGRDEKWKKDTIKSLSSPEVFRREFSCEFDQIGEAALDGELLDKMSRECLDPEIVLDNGAYNIWITPKENRIYAAGVDIAEGVGKDSSVIQILDITDLKNIIQCAVFRSNTITPTEFTAKLYNILQNWGNPIALIERNNCGAQVVDNLKREYNYENIVNFGASLVNTVTSKRNGIISHQNVKYKGVQNYRYWVNTLKCVQINDRQTVNELSDFTRNPNGTWCARSNKHDDHVMTLIWALFVLADDIVDKHFEILVKDDNNKPMEIKKLEYGYDYQVKATSIYTNERVGVGAELPILFGRESFEDDNMIDLGASGWEILNKE